MMEKGVLKTPNTGTPLAPQSQECKIRTNMCPPTPAWCDLAFIPTEAENPHTAREVTYKHTEVHNCEITCTDTTQKYPIPHAKETPQLCGYMPSHRQAIYPIPIRTMSKDLVLFTIASPATRTSSPLSS